MADLAGEKLLMLEDGHCLRDQAMGFCKGFTLFDQREDRTVELTAIELRQQLMGLRLMQIHFHAGYLRRPSVGRARSRADGGFSG
jgi:hypothetical protein